MTKSHIGHFFSNPFPQAIGFYRSQQSLWWTRICPEGWHTKYAYAHFPFLLEWRL